MGFLNMWFVYICMSIPTYVRTYVICVLFWTLVDYYMQNVEACVCTYVGNYVHTYIDWCTFLLQPHAFVIKKVIKPDVCQVVSARLDPGLKCLDRFGQNPSPVFSHSFPTVQENHHVWEIRSQV